MFSMLLLSCSRCLNKVEIRKQVPQQQQQQQQSGVSYRAATKVAAKNIKEASLNPFATDGTLRYRM